MSNLQQAADDARRLLRGFKAFDEVADALDSAASLEQRVKELEASIPALKAEREALVDEIANGKQGIKDAKAKAETLVAYANTNAKAITDAANAEAASIVQVANDERASVQLEVSSLRQGLADEAADHATKVLDLSKEVADLEARAEKARAYLAKLQG